MRTLRFVLLFLGLCWTVVAPGVPGSQESNKVLEVNRAKNRAILKKLDAIGVYIWAPRIFDEFARRAQNIVELRLKQAGLKVHSGNYSDIPTLWLEVSSVTAGASETKPTGTLEAYVRETVIIPRNGEQLLPETWRYLFLDSHTLPNQPSLAVLKSEPKNEDELVSAADSVAAEFVNDYLAANPKK